MSRTLLIGGPQSSWREYIRAEHKGRDLIILDPADTTFSAPGRFNLIRDDKPISWRFFGSLDAQRAPHLVLTALAEFLAQAESPIIQLFGYRPTPLNRQTAVLAAQIARPDELIIDASAAIDLEGWPIGPTQVVSDKAFPALVASAQRKARWLKMIEDSSLHEVILATISIEGARLGSGQRVSQAILEKAGIVQVLHAEVTGHGLFLICDNEPEEQSASRILDLTHTNRLHIAAPGDYDNLLVGFARQSGEDFGMGRIEHIDFAKGIAMIQCTAVPPAPIRILKVGGLKVNKDGNELDEIKPWQI